MFFQPNPQMWERNLGSKEGRWVRLFGKVGRWQKRPAMIHPKIEYIDLRQELTGGGLHPIYPEIPGIKGPQLQRILGQALEWVRQGVIDPILKASGARPVCLRCGRAGGSCISPTPATHPSSAAAAR